MDINTNAWHYKIFSFAYDTFKSRWDRRHMETMSLCPYFWWVVTGIAWAAFIICAVIAIVTLFVPAIPVFLLVIFDVMVVSEEESLTGMWFVFGLVELVFGLVFGGFHAVKAGWQWIKSKRTFRVKVDKPDSLVVSYIKAKKSKFCPTVNFNKE